MIIFLHVFHDSGILRNDCISSDLETNSEIDCITSM